MSSIQFKKRARSNVAAKKLNDSDSDDGSQELVLNTVKKSNTSISESATQSNNTSKSLVGSVVYESTREIVPQQYAGNATSYTEIDTSADRDARAILERNIKLSSSENDGDTKVYQGQNAYKSLIPKTLDQVSSNKVSGTQGPIRAPSFLRATCRFDYAPDICKDYKETGFCGWGDNCKFLHDRGDYKSGWQLEKEWDEKQTRKKKLLEEKLMNNFMKSTSSSSSSSSRRPKTNDDGDDDDVDNEFNEILAQHDEDAIIEGKLNAVDGEDDEENYEIPEEGDDNLPFACFLCRETFEVARNPIITLCGHYFCSDCIIGHEKKTKTSKCPVCDKQMYGVFNRATKLLKRLADVSSTSSSSSKVVNRSKPRSSGFVVIEEGVNPSNL